MDKTDFMRLHDSIEDHPVFHNQSNNKQAPVSHQLAVFVHRLGTHGNGSSVGLLAYHFKVSSRSNKSTLTVHGSMLMLTSAFEYSLIDQRDRSTTTSNAASKRSFQGMVVSSIGLILLNDGR
jgi:hypothetical protein